MCVIYPRLCDISVPAWSNRALWSIRACMIYPSSGDACCSRSLWYIWVCVVYPRPCYLSMPCALSEPSDLSRSVWYIYVSNIYPGLVIYPGLCDISTSVWYNRFLRSIGPCDLSAPSSFIQPYLRAFSRPSFLFWFSPIRWLDDVTARNGSYRSCDGAQA